MNKRKKQYNVDSVVRTEDNEKQLNALVHSTFKTASGKKVLSYLKSITVNTAHGVGVDPTSLMHIEGQRWIVGLLEQRFNDHLDGKLHEE
jgi:hypothetical protein|tara:strand:+ start:3139 stop:3408 length:270 start_codon:yes stop_codon:yes gene_type:complete